MRNALLADDLPAPLVAVLRARRARREWDNVRAFRLVFSTGDQVVLLSTLAPPIAGAIRYSSDGDVLPSFFTVQHPRLHVVRADEVLSCVEIDVPRGARGPSRRSPVRRPRKGRSMR
jgi:hypothetical protein